MKEYLGGVAPEKAFVLVEEILLRGDATFLIESMGIAFYCVGRQAKFSCDVGPRSSLTN